MINQKNAIFATIGIFLDKNLPKNEKDVKDSTKETDIIT